MHHPSKSPVLQQDDSQRYSTLSSTVLITAENASAIFGGEAVLPLHYYRRLRSRGMNAFLLTHARNRDALLQLMPEEESRLYFVPETRLLRILCKLAYSLPSIFGRVFIGPIIFVISQRSMRRMAKELVQEKQIDIVHQPMPVSPKNPSLMYRLGVPIIIGPLNGGMNYPPGFRYMEGGIARHLVEVVRTASHWIHRFFPGKLEAHTVLVANKRTRDALPRGVRGSVVELVENGVDLAIWQAPKSPQVIHAKEGPTTFVFVGRLVDWKGVDLLLQAVSIAGRQTNIRLEVIGDGVERANLERLRTELGLTESVDFHGWMLQAEIAKRFHIADAFILPSLWECGGAVVLEAMAAGIPVIATDWGGPADYIEHEATGVLVPPTNRDQFPKDLAAAMVRLANDPALRTRLASAALERVRSEYDWEKKIDRMLTIYDSALTEASRHPYRD